MPWSWFPRVPRTVLAVVALVALACVAGADAGALAAAPSASPTQQRAGTASHALVSPDPKVGPHAADEARHRKSAKQLPPATSRPIPRRLGNLPPLAGGAARPSTSAPLTVSSASGPFLQREVFGFAPYWTVQDNAQWNYRLLSTVAYFGLTVKADGTFDQTAAGWNQWNSQDLVNTVNGAHTAGDRAVVVIKQFDTPTINALVTSPTATQAAITNVIAQIQAKNLDGVNVDFEGASNPAYPNLESGLVNFMSQLSQQVHAKVPNSEVSIDTYSGSASCDCGIFHIGDLAPVVDAMFVMAYDMAFDDTPGDAGANAPLTHFTYNDTLSVSQYLAKAPASKVLLGVPYYGYKWSTSSNAANATATSGATADTYANIVAELSCGEPKFAGAWDSYAMSPWLSWYSPASGDPCGANLGTWRELYYDNPASLGYKYDLVNANDLRGAGMWALGYDGTVPDLWNEIALKLSTVTPWDTIFGSAIAGPAASGWSSWEDVFAVGKDGAVYRNSWNGASWSGWSSAGGRTGFAAASVSWAPNRVDLFVRGGDGALWHRAWNSTYWGAWESLGGNIAGGPAAASWSANRLDVFVRGVDNHLYHKAWNGYAWGSWEGLGGALGSAPAAVSTAANRIDVFARGTDGAMWQRAWTGTAWSAWQSLGGTVNSDPAVASCTAGHLDVFIIGKDGGLWSDGFNGTAWTGWTPQGGQWTSSPGATCRTGTTTVDVFERGFNSAIWHTNVPSS